MNIQFISAGAGSGKTTRLTELLSEQLSRDETRVRPEGVIATTFTRKAAGELLERVRRHLIENDGYRQANSMGQALIGTVNSVCGLLLQRYAFEAGLSPKLEVLAEDEQPILFVQALDQAMTREDIRTVNALASRLGIPDWQDRVREIIQLARANGIPPDALPRHAARGTDELLAYFPEPTDRDLDGELAEAVAAASQAIRVNEDTTKKTKDYITLLGNVAHAMENGDALWADWVKLSTKEPAKRSASNASAVREIASLYDRHPGLHADILEWNRRLFESAKRAMSTYQTLKDERGLMDFVDQEQRMLALLDEPTVAEALRKELDLLLVDEFQDTSPIQLAVFLKLAKLARESIWVGDVKQAIYGFRGTDPQLMRAVVDALTRRGKPIETLPFSWRSRPSLVELANALFLPAFGDDLEADQIRLIPKREEKIAYPPVQFWNLEGRNHEERANALSDAVAKLLGSGLDVIDKDAKAPRRMRPEDVAILSRTNANAARIAGTLSARGVAVTLAQPRLLATPEVHLTLACLRRLADPQDTLASVEIIALQTATEPETWLGDRLAYLEQGHPSSRWGIDGEWKEPALEALEAIRDRLDLLSPSEALDEVLLATDVRRAAKMWGPTKGRVSQRLANLETLRGLASKYEDDCGTRRVSATVAGFLLWLYERAAASADVKGGAAQANAVQVLTHHGAKGLEWPLVITADLESKIRGRVWGLSMASDVDHVDMEAPLARRWLRYWPWPFGKLSAGIPVARAIDASDLAQADHVREVAEARRLLYVSFTRARDLLICPLQVAARERPWLATLGADWFGPAEAQLRFPDGGIVSCETRTCPVPEEIPSIEPDPEQYWFRASAARTAKLPACLSPSALEPVPGASIGRVIETGARLAISGKPDMERLGQALHGIYAAFLSDEIGDDHLAMSENLLMRHGVGGAVDVNAVLEGVDCFRKLVTRSFEPQRILTEWPVRLTLENGQHMNGWIDVLLETTEGWIIIDHKSFPGGQDDWRGQALRYSGQLDAYRCAVEKATAKPVQSQWIHFAVAAGLVEVNLSQGEQNRARDPQ